MFDIFKKKKYYSCDFLNNELAFFTDRITSCCSGYDGIKYTTVSSPEDKISWNEILKIKKKNIKLLENGIIPEGCKNCYKLKPYEKAENYKFSRLVINHFHHCNCGCVYCALREFTNGKITLEKKPSDFYNLLPHIRELYKKNLLDKEKLVVEFQGGDLSVLDEFEALVDEFLENGVDEFIFTTNNIVFQPKIVEALKKKGGMYTTSLDCGTREMYKKLKRVDKFDDAINNLRRYKEELQQANDAGLYVKYIIVQGLNDNIEELSKFLDYMEEIKVNVVVVEINYHDILIHKNKEFIVPEHYYELFKYAEERCEKSPVTLCVWEYTKNVLAKGKSNEAS